MSQSGVILLVVSARAASSCTCASPYTHYQHTSSPFSTGVVSGAAPPRRIDKGRDQVSGVHFSPTTFVVYPPPLLNSPSFLSLSGF